MNALLRYGAAVAAGMLIAGVPLSWRHDAAMARLESQQTTALAAQSTDAAKRLKDAQDDLDAKAAAWAETETDLYGKLRNAENENTSLRADVDAGRQRLRVRAVCPSPSAGVSAAGTASGLDHGATAELDPASRPDYFALRDGIERVTRQLEACQSRLR
ncbi:lysis system i-spanin subunit Rz [Kerstersia gyiorum]|uniref:lysis system i-spanin subunit Rz n=1 Tax=Kerstersia gyiorum TaxID=206506 RepID=UPI0020A0656A|nr:lysis system i-spanin subunit Rz [Kerstersia gyiorum]MCP1679403.1 prophage endopeptidase [Kerstersia gyiorum]MCP1823906.1 prophage endopeptidase [Kerstersia gyiorum]MCP1827347.1 prophage endopeptidase [Kerstersia gyiorum]MCW2449004.1 prophage endopeptidase [Kerstersia gyiorum]